MSWQLVISAQIVVSAIMTVFTRRLTLFDNKLFFIIGAVSYGTIAVAGFAYSLIFGGHLPHVPIGHAWLYLIAEGICIPASWLLQYKIISKLGASNAVIVATLNNIGAALMGFVFLGDRFSLTFFLGAAFVLASIVIAFRIQPDTSHHKSLSLSSKALLVGGMVAFFSIGMIAEKQAISLIGVWNYAGFGWGLQFCGALILCLIYGWREVPFVTTATVRKALLLGLITSVAGGLYIYALSLGTLSNTIVAASGKIALTTLLAAIFLKERNALGLRLIAFGLSVVGLIFLVV